MSQRKPRVIEFWQQYPHAKFAEMLHMLRDLAKVSSTEGKEPRWRRRLRRNPVTGMAIGLGVWIAFMAAFCAVVNGDGGLAE